MSYKKAPTQKKINDNPKIKKVDENAKWLRKLASALNPNQQKTLNKVIKKSIKEQEWDKAIEKEYESKGICR